LAGAKVDVELDGVDLLPFLAGANKVGQNIAAPHETLFWRFGPQKAVRRGRWKLVDWRDFETKTQSGWQLYDLEADISESHDLASTHRELVAELTAAWDKWDQLNIAPLWPGSPSEDPRSEPAN
jgi:arylsulfatase A-like enzyme